MKEALAGARSQTGFSLRIHQSKWSSPEPYHPVPAVAAAERRLPILSEERKPLQVSGGPHASREARLSTRARTDGSCAHSRALTTGRLQHLKLASPATDACSHTDFWKSTLQLGGACERRLRGAMHATANAQWALVHRSTMAVCDAPCLPGCTAAGPACWRAKS